MSASIHCKSLHVQQSPKILIHWLDRHGFHRTQDILICLILTILNQNQDTVTEKVSWSYRVELRQLSWVMWVLWINHLAASPSCYWIFLRMTDCTYILSVFLIHGLIKISNFLSLPQFCSNRTALESLFLYYIYAL